MGATCQPSEGSYPPRRRSGLSTSHLSDRYKAESSRMNLVGYRAKRGPGSHCRPWGGS